MATRKLRHDVLDLPEGYGVEVWTASNEQHVTLFGKHDGENVYVHLSPDDADSLAVLLRGAANRVRARLAERSPS